VGSILIATIRALYYIYFIAIILRALISFAPIDPFHPLVRFLDQLTEPILRPIRNVMPAAGMFDFSPMIALFLLTIVYQVLLNLVVTIFR
jgi:YggT family protein